MKVSRWPVIYIASYLNQKKYYLNLWFQYTCESKIISSLIWFLYFCNFCCYRECCCCTSSLHWLSKPIPLNYKTYKILFDFTLSCCFVMENRKSFFLFPETTLLTSNYTLSCTARWRIKVIAFVFISIFTIL